MLSSKKVGWLGGCWRALTQEEDLPRGVRTSQGLATAKQAGAAPCRNPWAKQPLRSWPRSRERGARGFPPAPDLTPARLLGFQGLQHASRKAAAPPSGPAHPHGPAHNPAPSPYGLAPVTGAGGARAPRAASRAGAESGGRRLVRAWGSGGLECAGVGRSRQPARVSHLGASREASPSRGTLGVRPSCSGDAAWP